MAALLTASTFAQGRVSELERRFEQTLDPVGKAKLMPDLGEAEFAEIRKDVEADRQMDAVAGLEKYRDQAQACAKALDAAGLDAEKHSSGFKQLQISLRESLRRLDALLPMMTADDQAPFVEVRKELDELDRHLIQELFPGRVQAPPKAAKPKAEGPQP